MKDTIEDMWVMDKIMQMDMQFMILGTGEKEYEDMFKHFAYNYSKRSNVFLMPSLFEHCGLGQLITMWYGTVPIVRKTGGLKDTVIHYNMQTKEGTGFEFEECLGYWMYKKIEEAYTYYKEYPNHFKQIQLNGMKKGFAWFDAAKKYYEMYRTMI